MSKKIIFPEESIRLV